MTQRMLSRGGRREGVGLGPPGAVWGPLALDTSQKLAPWGRRSPGTACQPGSFALIRKQLKCNLNQLGKSGRERARTLFCPARKQLCVHGGAGGPPRKGGCPIWGCQHPERQNGAHRALSARTAALCRRPDRTGTLAIWSRCQIQSQSRA